MVRIKTERKKHEASRKQAKRVRTRRTIIMKLQVMAKFGKLLTSSQAPQRLLSGVSLVLGLK
jgi:hypothetical protein